MFSKACEYGIKATIFISQQTQKGERASLRQVAKTIGSPVAFTAKILQALAHTNIIISTKGATGGYEIQDYPNSHITLSQVVKAIDGDKIYNGCGLGLSHCNERKPCAMHFQFKAIRDDLKHMLMTTTIEELAEDMHKGLAVFSR